MTAPAVPVSDEVAVHRLLQVQDQLGDLLCAVPPERHRVIDGVLVALDSALTRLGWEDEEDEPCPRGTGCWRG